MFPTTNSPQANSRPCASSPISMRTPPRRNKAKVEPEQLNQLTEVTTENSGILSEHLEVIKDFCSKENLCLFIRPTESASTRLIGHGYETKSVDIHAKSANGGLAKGFIPYDEAFSKKGKQFNLDPQFELMLSEEVLDDYQKVFTTPLYMSTQLLNEIVSENSIAEHSFNFKGDNGRYFTAQDNSPSQVIYKAVPKDEGEWVISFMPIIGEDSDGGPVPDREKETPLYVYAYKDDSNTAVPVTGDYDLASIVSARENFRTDSVHLSIGSHHGESITSPYGTYVIKQLNQLCDKNVFRHGAETQNIHFAQPMDDRLICITPTGKAYIVPREKIAEASYDLICRGYLVKLNPVYDQDNLPLSGKYFGIIPRESLDSYQALYDKLKPVINKLRQFYHQSFINDLKNSDAGVEQADEVSTVTTLKTTLINCLKTFKDENGQKIDLGHANDIAKDLTDILFYHERLKAYLNLAGESQASQQYKCFNHGDFPEGKSSGSFNEKTPVRDSQRKSSYEVSRNIGNPDYIARSPLQPTPTTTPEKLERSDLNKKREALSKIGFPFLSF